MTRRDLLQEGEKRRAADRLAALQRLAFSDDAVSKAGNVLERLLDSGNEKEARLAAERIRDERGLTRITHTEASSASIHVTLNTPWRDSNKLEQRVTPKRIGTKSVWLDHAKPAETQGELAITSDNGVYVALDAQETPGDPVPPETARAEDAS